jgi:hypothetical protein
VPSKIRVETKKFLFKIMTRGAEGNRIKALLKRTPSTEKYPSINQTKDKYFDLKGLMAKEEERLPLWLALPIEDKLKLISH